MENKLVELQKILKSYEKVVVAFSGGVDSTFLLKIANDVLGNNCIAITLQTSAHTKEEIKQAKKIAEKLQIKHVILPLDITKLDMFQKNPKDRCYHCKKYMFSKIKEYANNEHIRYVIEGSNADDQDDYRPGMRALEELDIQSPLQQVNLTKQEIRNISKQMKLQTWDKLANPCLATRIPYGEKITTIKLQQIEHAENILHTLGIREVRVRNHENIARIEVTQKDFQKIIDHASGIAKKFKELGFLYITLDLQGFRSGSLNEVI